MTEGKLRLMTLIKDHERSFSVHIDPDFTIGDLQIEVREKKKYGVLSEVDAGDLNLWKPNEPTSSVELHATLSKVELQSISLALSTEDRVSKHFPTQPGSGVHLIVELPPPANDLHRRKRSIEDVSHSPIDAPQSSKRAKLALERLHGSKTVYRTKSEQPSGSLSFPDGSDFHSLVTTSDLIAADKTQYIEKLDSSSTYHYMFLRPRRWGKSTFLRTLTDYYDKYTADTFNDKFGQLYIGKNPTPSHNTLLILFFDFSSIRTASYEVMQLDFDAYVLRTLRKFLVKYKDLLGGPDPETLPNRGSDALDDVFSLVMSHDERIFLGVDEYDAPANSCLFSSNSQHTANYETVSWLFKTQFYTIVKRHSSSPVSKSWLTGVLPVFREGISPLTATTIVSMMSRFHGLCGLSEDEVGTIAKGYLGESHPSLDQILQQLKRWFNGFIFVSEKEPSSVQDERHSPVVSLYNPQQVFTHLWKLSDSDSNPTMDAGGVHTDSVLKAIPNSSETGFSALDLMTVLTSTSDSRLDILREFGVSEVAAIGKDIKITWTILYYFGVLTFGENGRLRAPNETMRYLISTRLRSHMLLGDMPSKLSASCKALIDRKVQPLIDLLEDFFKDRPVRSAVGVDEATLSSIIEVFWADSATCLTELCLVVDPSKESGSNRFGFVDLFIDSPLRVTPIVELKNITPRGLAQAQGNIVPSSADLAAIRKQLGKESEEELLKRTYRFWDHKIQGFRIDTIANLKASAKEQLGKYLHTLSNGKVIGESAGILDVRVRCVPGTDTLQGFLVIAIGGTRVLAYEGGHLDTSYSYRKIQPAPDVG